jgi:hypothetical protein
MSKADAAAKKVANTPKKVERAGSADTGTIDKRGAAFQQLKRTGRVDHAAAAFESIL